MTNNAHGMQLRTILSHDLRWWKALVDALLLASLAIAAAAAAIVGFSTYFSMRWADEIIDFKDRELARYQTEASGKVADAARAASEAARAAYSAGEQAGSAQSTAETAKADADRLEKETADENLKTEQIRSSVAWRELASLERKAILKAASSSPGAVNIRYTDGDPEALNLALQFKEVFFRAGWPLGIGAAKLDNALLYGIVVAAPETLDGEKLRDLLHRAGVETRSETIPEGVGFNVSSVNGPTLFIGSKPRDDQ